MCCVRTACILRTQRPGYSPKNTYHLTSCTAKQQSPHENNETALNLVLHFPYGCGVVGMTAVPQTPQGPRGLTSGFYEQSAKYSSSAADNLKLYHHILGSRCLFDIWQKTWERHERSERGCVTIVTPTVGKIGPVSSIALEG